MMISKRDMMLGGLAGALSALIPGVTVAAGVIRVPIRLWQGGTPLVELTIGGRGPYKFIMDTGASVSAIHDHLAVELGLQPATQTKLHGVGGATDGVVYLAKDVVFGGSLRQDNVALMGLKNFRTNAADGLLAAGFLTALPSELDFEAREIRIYNQVKPDFSGFQMLNAYRSDLNGRTSPKILVRAKIDGVSADLCLDTGFPGEVLLSSDFVRRNRLWDKYPDPKLVTGFGISGNPTPQRMVRVPGLDLGGIAREAGDVQLISPEANERDRGYDGLLGMRILREYTLAFVGAKGVGVKPNAFFGKPWTGPSVTGGTN